MKVITETETLEKMEKWVSNSNNVEIATPENTSNWDHEFSAWESRKATSSYHFSTKVQDYRWDTVIGLGHITPTWQTELQEAIESAQQVTAWSRNGTGPKPGKKYHIGEYNDMINMGVDPSKQIFLRVERNIAPVFQRVADAFGLTDMGEVRLHIQHAGEAFLGHVDGFHHNWPGVDLDDLVRILVCLNDYEQGQFFQFGNHMWQNWRAGDVVTFSNLHVPHYTANCCMTPRCQLLLTGVKTEKTNAFLKKLRHSKTVEV